MDMSHSIQRQRLLERPQKRFSETACAKYNEHINKLLTPPFFIEHFLLLNCLLLTLFYLFFLHKKLLIKHINYSPVNMTCTMIVHKDMNKDVVAFMTWVGPSFRLPLGMLKPQPQSRATTLSLPRLSSSTTQRIRHSSSSHASSSPTCTCAKSSSSSPPNLSATPTTRTVKAAINGPLSNNGSVGGRGPRGLDGPFFSSETNGELRWRDRVALYAQFSPEETLQCILEALKENGQSGPIKDDGIEALYTFANFDVFEVDHKFFGRRMDLGQFERFRRVLITKPYSILLYHAKNQVLSSLRLSNDKFRSRIRFQYVQNQEKTFTFSLSKVKLGDHESWMIDSVLEELDPDEYQK